MTKKNKEVTEIPEDDSYDDVPAAPTFFTMSEDMANEVDDAEPLRAAPKGEYELKLTDYLADKDTNKIIRVKPGKQFVMPMYEVVDHPDAENFKGFSYYLQLPTDNLEGKERKRVSYAFKVWCQAHGVNWREEIDWAELKGRKVEAKLEVVNNPTFGEQNSIAMFIGC